MGVPIACCFNTDSVAKFSAAERWLQYPIFVIKVSTSRHLCVQQNRLGWEPLFDPFPGFSFGHNLAAIVTMKDNQAVFPHLLLLSGTQLSDGPFHTATHQGAVGPSKNSNAKHPKVCKMEIRCGEVSLTYENHLILGPVFWDAWKKVAWDASFPPSTDQSFRQSLHPCNSPWHASNVDVSLWWRRTSYFKALKKWCVYTIKSSLRNQMIPNSMDSPSASTPIFSSYILKRCQLKPRSFCS